LHWKCNPTVAAELTPSIRAAAETVQATFLLRELIMEPSGLFIEFSYFFRFAFIAFNQSGQNYGCKFTVLRRFGGTKRRRLSHKALPLVKRLFLIL
jgi:hypothetical protein